MSKAEIIKRPIERVGQDIKKSAWSALAGSLAVLIMGILLVVWPNITIIVVANILGAIFISSGIYQIVNYFVVRGQNDFFNNGLLSGVVAVLIGVTAIVVGENLAGIFRIIIGVWVVYESLVHINTAIKLRTIGIGVWSWVLIIALVMLALGIFVTFNSGAVVQLVGWIMIAAGVIGIVGDAMFIQHVNTVVERITK